jgi:hypothetical protein
MPPSESGGSGGTRLTLSKRFAHSKNSLPVRLKGHSRTLAQAIVLLRGGLLATTDRAHTRAKTSVGSLSAVFLFLRLVRVRYAWSISRLTIHACLPTCLPLVNPYCSNSSAVALNRNRP